jgi:hypothetical protein
MDYLNRINGKVEVAGQRSTYRERTRYAYLRVLDQNGVVHMMKDIWIPNTVDSYIRPGTQGTFYIAKLPKKENIIFAYSNDERNVYDSEDMELIVKEWKRYGRNFMFNIPLAIFSIIFMGIGLFLTPMCIYYAYHFRIKLPKKYGDSILREYLSQNGFSA